MITSGAFKMQNPQPWTRWDEVRQRIGNVRRMLMFAWLAARHDSATFAVVLVNSCRSAGDGLIATVMLDGRRIDPEGISAGHKDDGGGARLKQTEGKSVMTTEELLQRQSFADRLDDELCAVRAMLRKKNVAYGNSALDPVRVFSEANPVEQIKVRLDDKISRLVRGQAAGEDVEDDLLGYLFLLRIARRLEAERAAA